MIIKKIVYKYDKKFFYEVGKVNDDIVILSIKNLDDSILEINYFHLKKAFVGSFHSNSDSWNIVEKTNDY